VRGGRLLAPRGYEPDESHEALAALQARPVGDIAQCVSARRVHDPSLHAFTSADLAPLP
jgi:hypothetical protein